MKSLPRAVAITAAAITAAFAAPSIASADPCSCVTTIDGYVFAGVPYAQAVDQWLALYNTPGYQPGNPVTSISVTTTVSGTVEGDGTQGR